jgi:aspartyl/asparaginyl-tRNA synthetase
MEKSVLDMRNKEKKEILRIEEGVWRLLREIINEKGFVEIKKKKII